MKVEGGGLLWDWVGGHGRYLIRGEIWAQIWLIREGVGQKTWGRGKHGSFEKHSEDQCDYMP